MRIRLPVLFGLALLALSASGCNLFAARYYNARGLAYYKKGDFANAREQFEAVHKLQPKDARVALLLGDVDLRLQKSAEAVAVAEGVAEAVEAPATGAGVCAGAAT